MCKLKGINTITSITLHNTCSWSWYIILHEVLEINLTIISLIIWWTNCTLSFSFETSRVSLFCSTFWMLKIILLWIILQNIITALIKFIEIESFIKGQHYLDTTDVWAIVCLMMFWNKYVLEHDIRYFQYHNGKTDNQCRQYVTCTAKN